MSSLSFNSRANPLTRPDSDGRKQMLAEELKTVNSASDPELVSAAQS